MPSKPALDHNALYPPPAPAPLTLLLDGKPVGTVRVDRASSDKVFGTLEPGPGFEPFRAVFEAAVRLSQEIDAVTDAALLGRAAWDRKFETYRAIVRLGPSFAEMPAPIEEFAVDGDWSVEVTFADAYR